MSVKVAVTFKNFNEIVKKLNHDKLFGGPWTKGMKEVGEFAKNELQATAPLNRESFKLKMDPRPVPLYAKIEFEPVPKKTTTGKPMGYIFNVSGKYHRRSTSPIGAATKQWIDKVKKKAKTKLNGSLGPIGKAIQAQWVK